MSLSEELKHLQLTGYRGKILLENDPEYELLINSNWNVIYNGRKPLVIFRVLGAADVSKAVLFAKKHKLEIVARSGGHSAQGKSTTQGGVLVDLSALKHVLINPHTKEATVGTGCLLGDIDNETAAHNLAVPLGTAPITGIGGLGLHGGIGLLSKKYGLTMDNIIEVEVVTANGDILRASERAHSDLFWGIRGAASNFGIVTSIVFRLYDVGPTVYGGNAVQPQIKFKETLEWTRDINDLRQDIGCAIHFTNSPHGPIVASMIAHYGPIEQAKQDLAGLTSLAPVVMGDFQEQPYSRIQASLGPILAGLPPSRQYGKTLLFRELTDELIDLFVKEWTEIQKHPVLHGSLAVVMGMGGAISKVGEHDSPFSARESRLFMFGLLFAWSDPQHDTEAKTAAMAFYHKFATVPGRVQKAYINHDNTESLAAHGDSVTKLKQIKQKWDPENLFRGSLTWD